MINIISSGLASAVAMYFVGKYSKNNLSDNIQKVQTDT